jgi:hypothetical protein
MKTLFLGGFQQSLYISSVDQLEKENQKITSLYFAENL